MRLPPAAFVAAAWLSLGAATSFAQQGVGTPAQPRPPRPKPIFEWKDHPTIRKGLFELAFRARVQADVRQSDLSDDVLDDDDQTGLDVARRRVGVEGKIGDRADFQVEFELRNDRPWRDVYISVEALKDVHIQAGRFKQPFSLDENTGATNLDFVYRSLAASTLAPGRDEGVMVHGRPAGGLLRYELGVFANDGDNARPGLDSDRVSGGQTMTGRVGVVPMHDSKSPLADLLVGVAWSSTDVAEGFSTIRGRSALGARFFSSDFWVQGARRRVGYELRWRPGPASLKAEYIRLTEERLEESVDDTALSPLRATGWYISGTLALTGERKADGLDAPKRPFLRGGIGAVEVAGRIERLSFASGHADETPSTSPRAEVVVGNRNDVMTIGANWYLNRWIKIQYNLIRERLEDPAQGPLASQPAFWSRVLRFQFTL
jgi:phosphate-selective porin OprO/OprP